LPLGAALDVGDDAEVLADEQTLAFGDLVLGEIVGDAVVQSRIVNGDPGAVAGEVEVEEVATCQVRCGGPGKEVTVELRSQRSAPDEADASWRYFPFPAELWIAVARPGNMNNRASASADVSAMFVGGQRSCCRFWPPKVVSIALYWAIRSAGPAIWTQPPLVPGSSRFNSLNVSSPFSCSQSPPDFGSTAMPKLLRWP
jgi:hypothetical protein